MLFAYSAVLFHSAIPHCHTNDAHALQHDTHATHHSCDGHHHAEDEPVQHEHQVCHIESLHGDYLKSESDYNLHADFSSIDIVQLIAFTLFQKEETQVVYHHESAILVRSCLNATPILRGPPAAIFG